MEINMKKIKKTSKKLPTMRYCLDEFGIEPVRANPTDAGLDLRIPHDCVVPARGSVVIDTGVHFDVPAGFDLEIKPKSGLNIKHDLVAFGVVDAGFTGSVVVKVYNLGDEDYAFIRGDKLTQVVMTEIKTPHLQRVESVDKFRSAKSTRGSKGFGSSGR